MSGGSFDNLYLQEPPDPEQLAAMAAEISGLGHAAAMEATLHADAAIPHDDPLRAVWRAVEWWRSGDSSREDALAALEEWGGRREPIQYEKGWLDCLSLYAWHKDGLQWVGSTGTTRRDAGVRFLTERGFTHERAVELVG